MVGRDLHVRLTKSFGWSCAEVRGGEERGGERGRERSGQLGDASKYGRS